MIAAEVWSPVSSSLLLLFVYKLCLQSVQRGISVGGVEFRVSVRLEGGRKARVHLC